MKYILLFFPLLLIFTGCSSKHQMGYDIQKVSSNINVNLSKVEDKEIAIVNTKEEQGKIINRYIKGHSFGVSLDMEVGKINTNVLSLFMNQYFKNTVVKEDADYNNFLTINSNIIDYKWDRSFPDIIHIDADVEIKAYLKDKLIVSKTYQLRDYDSSVVLVFGSFTLFPLIQETFHKGVLYLYETQFKPDLLKALEENI